MDLNANSANQMLDGSHATDYAQSFDMLLDMVDRTLDEFKFEIKQIVFPVFCLLYLMQIKRGFELSAKKFYEDYSSLFR